MLCGRTYLSVRVWTGWWGEKEAKDKNYYVSKRWEYKVILLEVEAKSLLHTTPKDIKVNTIQHYNSKHVLRL